MFGFKRRKAKREDAARLERLKQAVAVDKATYSLMTGEKVMPRMPSRSSVPAYPRPNRMRDVDPPLSIDTSSPDSMMLGVMAGEMFSSPQPSQVDPVFTGAGGDFGGGGASASWDSSASSDSCSVDTSSTDSSSCDTNSSDSSSF